MDIAPKLKTVSELKGKIKNILTDNEIINQDKYNEILDIFAIVIENGIVKYGTM
jgi:hypothetical protein